VTFRFPGWDLLGSFPDAAPGDVGSWLLSSRGQAMLLECPPGVGPDVVGSALRRLNAELVYATASHSHEDHFDVEGWESLQSAFPKTQFIHPAEVLDFTALSIGGEPCWLIKAPKHSIDDVVCVFRGVAMTGDIELGTLDSVNREVQKKTKIKSMNFLRQFCTSTGYHVHTAFSAHLNDLRENVHWEELFEVG
jgi:hypothetical protein